MSKELSGNALSYRITNTRHAKSITRIPESHSLHVGPAACARRHAIKGFETGDDGNLSYLNLDEADLVSGQYEQLIIDAVGALNKALPERPRIYLIWLKCIDDLLGTDDEALSQELHAAYPGQKFALCHIDPIALGGTSLPGMKMQASYYGFLDAGQKRDGGVNLVGSFVPIDPACELHELIRSWDMGPIRQLQACRRYDEYQAMGKSALTMVLGVMCERAAQHMEERLGIPYCQVGPVYDPEAVAANYRAIADAAGKPLPDMTRETEQAHEALRQAARKVAGRPIVIDSSAVAFPFLLAETLIDHGFTISHVMAKRIEDCEVEAKHRLERSHPELSVLRSLGYRSVTGYGIDPTSIVIGDNCARMLALPHHTDIWHDEGFFGFHGIRKLADEIIVATTRKTNWPHLPIPGKEDL